MSKAKPDTSDEPQAEQSPDENTIDAPAPYRETEATLAEQAGNTVPSDAEFPQ